ncbi:apoptosis inhibitor [Cotia virus SPAn232]|uniref:Apoptosis inhibitor n=2 Tax=Cotia virus TaxID=39444 RepID=H6TAI7_9POXV|nr:apoptosis inhibitor [Cotia virus SPAn232]AFB76924.1 apoptosis inhibitor [Cotia virus SPAn232]AIT70649.1 apoptosis inhibitor [Cotia virus]
MEDNIDMYKVLHMYIRRMSMQYIITKKIQNNCEKINKYELINLNDNENDILNMLDSTCNTILSDYSFMFNDIKKNLNNIQYYDNNNEFLRKELDNLLNSGTIGIKFSVLSFILLCSKYPNIYNICPSDIINIDTLKKISENKIEIINYVKKKRK